MSFYYQTFFSGSQAQMNTTNVYQRPTETYPSEYEAGTSTILRYFYQNKIYLTDAFIYDN